MFCTLTPLFSFSNQKENNKRKFAYILLKESFIKIMALGDEFLEIKITNKSSVKTIDIAFEETEKLHKTHAIDKQITKINPGETKIFKRESEGRCIAILVHGMETLDQGWYMIPICDSPILIYPEEGKVVYKGHSLPKVVYKDGNFPKVSPNRNLVEKGYSEKKSYNWLLYGLLVLLIILSYLWLKK
jgi:hypothetical protein